MKKLVFLFLAGCMFGISPIFSQEITKLPQNVPKDSVRQMNYANFLFQQKEYYRAITEYKRYLFYFSDKKEESFAHMQIGRALMAGGQTEAAVKYWKEQQKADRLNSEIQLQIKVYLSVAYLDLDIEKPFSLRKKNVDSALGIIDSMDSNKFIYKDFHRFAESYREYNSENNKSPFLAGTLSAIVPGSGSVYNGRYIEGTYVFLLTSLFLYAALDSYRNGPREYVPTFAFFTLAFYGGGIYTAVNGAYKLNDRRQAEYLSEQRTRHRIFYDQR